MGFETSLLPLFPWDTLAPFKREAAAHPDGLLDFSVGTPVDPTPELVREALANAANSPGYPPTIGTPELRRSIVRYYQRHRGVPDLPETGVLPTVGSKEMVAVLPALLGVQPGEAVVHPPVAYPTYDVGARLTGATPVPAASPAAVPEETAERVRLVWLNSPGNPTGAVLSVEQLRQWVEWARYHGAVVAADECYAALAWDEPWASQGVPSILDPRVRGESWDGLLALHSLSKESNVAGYRAAFLAGDPELVGTLSQVRKHMGMMLPAPVQAAMVAALADDAHVAAQREVYRRRREVLATAITRAGYQIEGSGAGLYLWFTNPNGQNCWNTVAELSARGILVAPGEFYGPAGQRFVRLALTATDAACAEAAKRLL
ncbi:MAG: succinyldiaminopimelate transaminase [Bifidobacteriaceae bacterium]|nr:succinyldiaminopimelate transaminase [Bifidobacteriaceae bacterium]